MDTTNLDLGVESAYKIPKALKYFNKMENTTASFNMRIFNNTNVYMKVFALAAPDSLRHRLMRMQTQDVWSLINDSTRARQLGYVSFLGSKGVGIPARGTVSDEGVVLDQWKINQMFGSDTTAWRWEARFLPYSTPHPDSLRDTDYVKINSWVHLDGINCLDSIFLSKDSSATVK
jgi:hypothetical protein